MAKQETAAEPLEFLVDEETCIGCVACADTYSDIFKMVEDKAVAFAKAEPGSVRPSKVVKCCPVDAISLTGGEMDEGDEQVTSLPVVEGWQGEWEKHKNDPEDLLERERRYGRVLHLLKEAKGFRLRIELPRTIPNHSLIYMYGIGREAPEYEYVVEQVGPATLSVRARITDSKLRFVAGKINSFPISFKVDYRFLDPIGACYRRLYEGGIEIYAFKEGVMDTDAQLRKAMIANVA
ncbi:MAG: ferredoxin [Candidatus Krumholzibacteriia bacterium]